VARTSSVTVGFLMFGVQTWCLQFRTCKLLLQFWPFDDYSWSQNGVRNCRANMLATELETSHISTV